MTTKQLLAALSRIAKGHHYCYGCAYGDSCNTSGCTVVIAAMRQIEEKQVLEGEIAELRKQLKRANDDQRRREALLYPELK